MNQLEKLREELSLQDECNALKAHLEMARNSIREHQQMCRDLEKVNRENAVFQHDQIHALQKQNKELKTDLIFVERWANHHAQKSNFSAKEVLSCIQHYPSISSITKSYEDGLIPATRNPYAEIEALQKENARLQELALTAEKWRGN